MSDEYRAHIAQINKERDEPESPARPDVLPASKLTDERLVQTLIKCYARSFMYPDSEIQHNRWVECKGEVLHRLASPRVSAAPAEAVAAPSDAVGLNLLRQLVGGKNPLRLLDTFSCNSPEHDGDLNCECFWEQCEAWAKADAPLPLPEKQ